MATLFSLNFEFENIEYSCLISTMTIENSIVYKITVMNGDLERILYGENLLKELNGVLEIPLNPNLRQEKLKYSIALALKHHLQSRALTGSY